ncbi:hypothetical protein C8Q78DRAFT_656213 [Trametes maxima]|nr:hypothetical protein C8Q78DRAFT_656213 [Trametes maxima]
MTGEAANADIFQTRLRPSEHASEHPPHCANSDTDSDMNPPPQTAPPWLGQALQEMRMRYPADAFDVVAIQRPNPSTGSVVTVFRAVCGDCPGKLYTVGPGDTLNNFEIHLRDLSHRRRVDERSQPRRSFL